MIQVKIRNTQKRVPLNKNGLAAAARQTLRIKGMEKAELSVLFVGKQRIRRLNKKYRNSDRACDVLSFGMHNKKEPDIHPHILGDVVICPQVARESAKRHNTTTKYEIYLYLVHGILHLLGYRDSTAQKRLIMEKEQNRILNRIMK